MARTRKDSTGRTWEHNDAEGCWTSGPHTIGCGGKNGRKWMIWSGPQQGYHEFKTLREAMDYCKSTEAKCALRFPTDAHFCQFREWLFTFYKSCLTRRIAVSLKTGTDAIVETPYRHECPEVTDYAIKTWDATTIEIPIK